MVSPISITVSPEKVSISVMDSSLGTQAFFQPGVLIGGRYEAVCTLGSGGMGSVLKVVDRALDNEVIALKLLYPHLAQDKTSFARFRNEVIIARRLAHPNIVRLYDFGHAGNGYYFVTMEFVPGGNLTNYIYEHRRDLLAFDETLRMLREIALGMAHAHKMGVVHRDLKPDNILLGERKEVKITDFGLARTTFVDKGFTDTGEAVGTPYYMSPEQLSGLKVDGRSDIYSFGIIAYEAAVGIRPFFEENYMTLARQHLHEPLPDFAKDSGIPRWYEKFVKKCAEKIPDDRFQSADEIAEILGDAINQLGGNVKVSRVFVPGQIFGGSARTKRRWQKTKKILGTLALFAVFLGILVTVINSSATLKGTVLGLTKRLHFKSSEAADKNEFLERIALGDIKAVQTLVAAGAQVNAVGYDGKTPLHLAIFRGNYEVARYLLEQQADVNAKDSNGDTPIILAAANRPSEPNYDFAQELLRRNVDLEAWNFEKKTAVMQAAVFGNLPVLKLLLSVQTNKQGQNNFLRTQDADLETALILAVRHNEADVVKFLLNYNKSDKTDIGLELADKSGKNALFYAAELEDSDLAEALVKAGIDPNVKDFSGKVALDYAKERNRKFLKPLTKK